MEPILAADSKTTTSDMEMALARRSGCQWRFTMRKFLAFGLMLLIVFGTTARTAFASSDHRTRQIEKLKAKLDGFPLGTHLQVRLTDHWNVAGILVARFDDGIEVAAPEFVSMGFSEMRTVAVDDDGQSTSSQNQNPPVHHSHYLRNFLIVFGAGAVLYFVLAAADK
jgi:hypothetical protein